MTTTKVSGAVSWFLFLGAMMMFGCAAPATDDIAPSDLDVSEGVAALTEPDLATLTLARYTVHGGTPAIGTVTLTAPAPAGGTAVAVGNDHPELVGFPFSVVVAEGETSATFSLATLPPQSGFFTFVSLTATLGTTTVSTILSIQIPLTVSTVFLYPDFVEGGFPSIAEVVMNGINFGDPAEVLMQSSNPAVLSPPPVVTVQPARNFATFSYTTTPVASPTPVTIAETFPAGTTRSSIVSVLPPPNAVFDDTLQVPRCAMPSSFCDTGSLLTGRGNIAGGPEPHAPNTLGGTCADGAAGAFHMAESLDRLRIWTLDGRPFAEGKQVEVGANTWGGAVGNDSLDIFFAADAANPVWQWMVTTQGIGQLPVSARFILPAGLSPAIRATVRQYGVAEPCSAGAFDDHDDLAFVSGPPVNDPPTVDVGADQTITLPEDALLAASATDDGAPNPPGALTLTWSTVSGPGTVTFADPAAAQTGAHFSVAGIYVLRLTANDGVLSASDDLVVTVLAPVNQAPFVDAGPDQTITTPSAVSLSGTVGDDGLPTGVVTTKWTKASGPGVVTFANSNASSTTATFSTTGTYVLRLTVSDGVLTARDTVTVVVRPITLKAQYRITDVKPNDQFIRPTFNLVNTGNSPIALSQIKLRYWYTLEGQGPQVATCDSAQIGCNRITQTFVVVSPGRPGADRYVEVGFTPGAGNLPPGGRTGPIELRVRKANSTNFVESNDYSYASSATERPPTNFVDWTRITLYQTGAKIWGNEP